VIDSVNAAEDRLPVETPVDMQKEIEPNEAGLQLLQARVNKLRSQVGAIKKGKESVAIFSDVLNAVAQACIDTKRLCDLKIEGADKVRSECHDVVKALGDVGVMKVSSRGGFFQDGNSYAQLYCKPLIHAVAELQMEQFTALWDSVREGIKEVEAHIARGQEQTLQLYDIFAAVMEWGLALKVSLNPGERKFLKRLEAAAAIPIQNSLARAHSKAKAVQPKLSPG